eukprot:1199234-Rhodomonas_salina.1
MERLPHSQASTFGQCACVQGRHDHMEACFRRPILQNNSDFFISTSEALILTNNKFNFFVNHQAPDYLTPGPCLDAFKKAVITYLVAHRLVFPIDANNIAPTLAGKFAANYAVIVKMMKGIQGQ